MEDFHENAVPKEELEDVPRSYASAVMAMLREHFEYLEPEHGNYTNCERCGDETYGNSHCDKCRTDIAIEHENAIEAARKSQSCR